MGKFLGQVLGWILALCLPGLFKRSDESKIVKQKGKDDVTDNMLDTDIWNSAQRNGVQRAEDKSTS